MQIRIQGIDDSASARAAWSILIISSLVACVDRPDGEVSATSPVGASPAPTHETFAHPPPTADAPADLSNAPAREVGPIGGGTRCLEMYSLCKTVEGERHCTSTPFSLECGEEARLPSTRELLRCMCPPGERVPNDPAADDPAPVTPSR